MRSPFASNQAPGDGERPRISQSSSRAAPLPVDPRFGLFDFPGVGDAGLVLRLSGNGAVLKVGERAP